MINVSFRIFQPLYNLHRSPIATSLHNGDHLLMSRLNYLLDHELAIQTILDELPVLEKYVADGGKFESADIRDLVSGLSRLAGIVKSVEHSEEPGWDADNEPLPPWLQLKPVDNKRPETFPGCNNQRPAPARTSSTHTQPLPLRNAT